MRILMFLLASAALAYTQATPPLRLEKTIELSDVQGRIDHLAVDHKDERLFVAALGNNTVEVIDIKVENEQGQLLNCKSPRIVYVAEANLLYVANGKDGTVRIFDANLYAPLKTLEYGDDADNLRYDSSRKRIYVGYGGGALGEFDSEGNKIGDIKLDAHPESFRLEENSPRIYVNLPKSRKVAVVDREKAWLSRHGEPEWRSPIIRWRSMKPTTGSLLSPGCQPDCSSLTRTQARSSRRFLR